MRKPLGLFVAAFATVAGGGLAFAVEGGPQQDGSTESTTTSTESTTTSTESTTTSTTVDVLLEEVEELETGDAGEHGAWVSDHARNLCGPLVDSGEFANHGECVSAAARDKDHDGTPDVPRETETVEGETETETVETEDGGTEPGAGHRTSDGAGHRDDSPGQGHGRHGG